MHWAEQNIVICQFSYGPIDLSTTSHNRGKNQIRAIPKTSSTCPIIL